MAEHTQYYNLIKPLGTEQYNIEDQNDNMDSIDEALHDIDGKIPLSATLANENARTYIFSDNQGNAYPTLLRRNYELPSWIVAQTGVSLTACTVEVMNNTVVLSFAYTLTQAISGTKNIFSISKYIPPRFVRSVVASESGDARSISFGGGSGNVVMYGGVANSVYRGEITFMVDTIPAE